MYSAHCVPALVPSAQPSSKKREIKTRNELNETRNIRGNEENMTISCRINAVNDEENGSFFKTTTSWKRGLKNENDNEPFTEVP